MALFDVLGYIDGFSGVAGSDGSGNLFDSKRKAWHQRSNQIPRCDFAPDRFALRSRGVLFHSLWRRSIYGRELSEIKQDDSMVLFIASGMAQFICRVLGDSLSSGSWAIVTPPPRRHAQRNFAVRVAEQIASLTGMVPRTSVASCRSRQRINAVFDLLQLPPEDNLVIFDDICTTGSTLQAMNRLLRPLGKNLVFFVAIENKI